MPLKIDVQPIVVEDDSAWREMISKVSRASELAVDTETVGFGTLALYQEAEARKKDLYEAALAHCAKFPIKEEGVSRNNQKGAKGSLARVMRVRKDVDRINKKAQSDLSGLRFWDCHLGCVQIGLRDNTVYMIRPQNFNPIHWQQLGKILSSPGKDLYLQNAQFDIKMLYTHCGILLDGRLIFDTKLAEWMTVNGKGGRTGLKALVKKHLDFDMSKDKSVRVSNWLGAWSKKHLQYAALDVALLFPLVDKLKPIIFNWGLKRALRLRCEFTTIAALMDMSGMPIDVEGLKEYKEELSKKLRYMDTDIRVQGQCEEDFNPNSPSQVYDMLAKHGIEVDDTNEKTLKKSSYSNHPLIEAILDYREIAKLLSYVEKYIDYSRDGRMYTQFHIDGTQTGRLSSGNPPTTWGTKDPYYTNAQNPPKGRFRSFIRALEGRKLIVADYSQIQIRWLARYSQDPVMLEAYMNDEDLHRITAAIIAQLTTEQFDALPEEKRKELRQKAKAVNFGVIFGCGPETLKNYAKMEYHVILTLEEAATIIRAWRDKYQGARKWQIMHPKRVTEAGFVRTASGFLRHFTKEKYPEGPYTDALNTPIQGSEADGMLNAMVILIYNLLDDGFEPFKDFWIPTNVHDEAVLECLDSHVEDLTKRLKESMEIGMLEFIVNIPVVVEPKVVQNWAEAK